MRTGIPLPKTGGSRDPELLLPGVVLPERKRCGKPTCRCASGRDEDLHGPYHYRYWRDDAGRLRKAYVRQADLPTVRAACERRAQARLTLAEERRRTRELLAALLRSLDDFTALLRHGP